MSLCAVSTGVQDIQLNPIEMGIARTLTNVLVELKKWAEEDVLRLNFRALSEVVINKPQNILYGKGGR